MIATDNATLVKPLCSNHHGESKLRLHFLGPWSGPHREDVPLTMFHIGEVASIAKVAQLDVVEGPKSSVATLEIGNKQLKAAIGLIGKK